MKIFNINLYLLIYYLSMALTDLEMYNVLRTKIELTNQQPCHFHCIYYTYL